MKTLTILAALLMTAAPVFADRNFNCSEKVTTNGVISYKRGCESTSTRANEVGFTPAVEAPEPDEEGEGDGDEDTDGEDGDGDTDPDDGEDDGDDTDGGEGGGDTDEGDGGNPCGGNCGNGNGNGGGNGTGNEGVDLDGGAHW
jgi:hypothetical protein